MIDMKKMTYSELICGIVGLAIGIVLVVTNGAVILSFITKLLGVVMLVVNIPRVLVASSRLRTRIGAVELAVSLIGAVIGVVVFLLPAAAVTVGAILAGAWFIVFPVLDIAASRYRSEQLKAELPKIILGVVLIVLGPGVLFSVLVKVIGGIMIVLSAIYIWRILAAESK